jgi:hypothetical protein
MVSREDVESFLIRAEVDSEELVPPTPSDESRGEPAIVVSYSPPVVVFRTVIRTTPDDEGGQLSLYRSLLELNATELVHGAYGLDDGEVVLADTLELENLDFSEFRASLESLALAVTSHWHQLTTD